MAQAVWQSPLLPLSTGAAASSDANPIGSGNRFRTDIIRYLHSYEKRLHKLTDQLALYDFSGIRAAFLGSAPSREVVGAADPSSQTSFGWVGLRQILSRVPSKSHRTPKNLPHIVLQVSSIATLGAAPTWLSHLQSVLAQSYTSQQSLSMLTPKFNIIFPTAEEVRTSLGAREVPVVHRVFGLALPLDAVIAGVKQRVDEQDVLFELRNQPLPFVAIARGDVGEQGVHGCGADRDGRHDLVLEPGRVVVCRDGMGLGAVVPMDVIQGAMKT